MQENVAGQRNDKVLYLLVVALVVLTVIGATVGVFYQTDGQPYEVTTQFGESVLISGSDLYAHDSHFVAPIFRGTDFTMLVVAIPLLLAAFALDMKRRSTKQRLLLLSVIGVFTYYATSIVFGVVYNSLHLLYIALFSTSFFGLILAFASLDARAVEESVQGPLPYRGIYAFLVVTGIALTVAWLPDIMAALLAGKPLAMLEIYTTSVTNVLDIGIIAPVAFVTLYLLIKRRGMGYILLAVMLTLCLVIGIMLPIQTIFQLNAGIELPAPVLVTKAGIFSLLAASALYFNVRLFRAIAE